eukprot:6492197-Amphidinium_carterae.1
MELAKRVILRVASEAMQSTNLRSYLGLWFVWDDDAPGCVVPGTGVGKGFGKSSPEEETYPANHISANKNMSDIEVSLDHVIPLQPTRTNVITESQTPRRRVFRAFTVRGSGVTQATYCFPQVLKAIRSLACTRPSSYASAPYASVQLTQAQFLPCHTDTHNLGMSRFG